MNISCIEDLSSICTFVDIENMTNEEWLFERRKGIGGSDCAGVLEMSQYSSPYTVYFDKKGKNYFDGNLSTRRGKLLEPIIRSAFEEFYGIKSQQKNCMFVNKIYPFMIANIDGFITIDKAIYINNNEVIGFGGHKIKSSNNGYGYSKEKIPDNVYCQLQHYMAVLNINWFVLSLGITETDEIRHYYITRNQSFIEKLIKKEIEFWNEFIVKDKIPSPIGIDVEDSLITNLYTGINQVIELDSEYENLCEKHKNLSDKIKQLESEKNIITTKIKTQIALNSNTQTKKGSVKAGRYNILWSKFRVGRPDTERMKQDCIYDEYVKYSDSGRILITDTQNIK